MPASFKTNGIKNEVVIITVLYNLSKQVVLASEVRLARTFQQRLRGWMMRSQVSNEEALILIPCRAVHTCFLKFPLDILFVASDGRVLLTLAALAPFRFSPCVRDAQMVIELAAGRLQTCNTETGDRLVLSDEEVSHVQA